LARLKPRPFKAEAPLDPQRIDRKRQTR